MHVLRKALRRLRILFLGDAVDGEMDEEMRFHLEMEEAELRRAGHAPDEARRLARVRFGGVDRFKERGRDARGARWAADLGRDLRYAVRSLRRRAGFTAAVLLTLALGVGASTAVFSVADTVLLRPLPYPDADRLSTIRTSWAEEPVGAMSPAEYLDYREGTGEVFAALAAYVPSAVTAGGEAGSERVPAVFASADLFPALGLEPVVGRAFTEEEELGGELHTVLTEGYWRRRFAGDPGVVGRTLRLNGVAYTVVGVMPERFRLPEDLVEGDRPEVILPLRIQPDSAYPRGSHFLQGVARMRPDVDVGRAAAVVEGIVERFVEAYPHDYEEDLRFQATVIPLREAVVEDVRPALLALLGAVLLVLLVATSNVATLFLARGESRHGELALRSTLGAGRGRLVRQLLVESGLLAVVGGGLGVVGGWAAVEGIRRLRPPGVPRLAEVGLDGRTLLFALLLTAVAGLLFGLLPALRAVPDRAARTLREAEGRTTGGESRRLRQVLVAGEIALAVTLVAGAGLLGRTLLALTAVDPGIRIEDVVSTRFSVPSARYPEAEDVREYVARVADRVAAVPGVASAGVVTNLPLAAGIGDLGVQIPGREAGAGHGDPNIATDWQVVTPGYADAVGLRLLRGRWIEEADRSDGPGAVVINRTMAERYWPEGDALGATVRLSAETAPGDARVVGIVEEVKHEGPDAPPRPQIYIPHRQFRFWNGGSVARGLTLVAHAPGQTANVTAAIRRAVREEDPEVGFGPFLTLEDAYRDVLARPRILAALLGSFAVAALLLAAVGVYGVMAYTVGRRRREFGIRMALGAEGRRIVRDVLAEGLRVTAAGVVGGVAGAVLLSGALRSLLFRAPPVDPIVVGGGVLLLAGVALVASWIPARRATRVDPVSSLRAE